jgi:hypothetical protein
MLAITIKAKGRDPHKFEWNGSSEELHKLWDEAEGLADSGGLDPVEAANAIIIAALSTVVGVLVEVPVMLSVVHLVRRSRGWYERATPPPVCL